MAFDGDRVERPGCFCDPQVICDEQGVDREFLSPANTPSGEPHHVRKVSVLAVAQGHGDLNTAQVDDVPAPQKFGPDPSHG